jgi:hypothetical protein
LRKSARKDARVWWGVFVGTKVNIQDLDKAELVAGLFNRSKGGIHATRVDGMDAEEARRRIDEHGSPAFDYFEGRLMKVDLSKDEFDPWRYDRINGEGAAQGVVDKVRAEAQAKKEKIFEAEPFQRLRAEAERDCEGWATEDLVKWAKGVEKFPGRRGIDDDNYKRVYDLTMVLLVLEKRHDVPVAESERLADATRGMKDYLAEVLNIHDKQAQWYEGQGQPVDFFARFHHGNDAYNHMVLAHMHPKHYGAEAAPEDFKEAVGIMADVWTRLLSGGPKELLFDRWQRGGDPGSFEVEVMQAAEKTYTDEQLDAFHVGLKRHLIHAGIKSVSMDYHPDVALKVAGQDADIWMGTTTFPCDTTTIWKDRLEGINEKPGVDYRVVKIYNGRGSNSSFIPVMARPLGRQNGSQRKLQP